MESLNLKDIEKPYKIIQQNLDDFNQEIKKKCELTSEQKKKLIENAQPVEITLDIYEKFCCLICLLLADKPIVCQKCDSIICKQCNADNLRLRGPRFKCPKCNTQKLPRKLSRLEQSSMDNILVTCSSKNCQKKDQHFTFEKFLNHNCNEIFNPQQCPQKCGKIINSFDEGKIHFEDCKNSIVSCILCQSSVKREQINDELHQKILGTINLQNKDLLENNEQEPLNDKNQREVILDQNLNQIEDQKGSQMKKDLLGINKQELNNIENQKINDSIDQIQKQLKEDKVNSFNQHQIHQSQNNILIKKPVQISYNQQQNYFRDYSNQYSEYSKQYSSSSSVSSGFGQKCSRNYDDSSDDY